MQFQFGKLKRRHDGATNYVGGEISRLLNVSDKASGYNFLVDSGAQVSLIPATGFFKNKPPQKLTLRAANGSLIETYGHKLIKLNIKLHKCYP